MLITELRSALAYYRVHQVNIIGELIRTLTATRIELADFICAFPHRDYNNGIIRILFGDAVSVVNVNYTIGACTPYYPSFQSTGSMIADLRHQMAKMLASRFKHAQSSMN